MRQFTDKLENYILEIKFSNIGKSPKSRNNYLILTHYNITDSMQSVLILGTMQILKFSSQIVFLRREKNMKKVSSLKRRMALALASLAIASCASKAI